VDQISYIGTELDLFSAATHWKSYWTRMIAPYCGPRVLDVGAGIGATAKLLCSKQQTRWLALEPDPALAERMRSANLPTACEVRVGTLASLAPQEQFDSILYIDVLEHIEDDMGELERAAAHLAVGGHIVVLSPAHQFLYTAFDKAIGHHRRYNRASLTAATPANLRSERTFYLDCAGMLANLGNRLLLNASAPTATQIRLWDGWMVPMSRILDPLTGYRLGKSIVGVWSLR
jgi:SAM-dependent methyltransferase